MLFGRRKPGFIEVEEIDDESAEVKAEDQGIEETANKESINEEKPELTDYLESLPDVEDPFAGIEDPIDDVEEVEEELTKAQELASYIRARSAGAELTKYSELKKEIDDLDLLLEEISEDEKCSDISSKQGAKDKYFYSTSNMSDNYAMIVSLVEDKDLVATIVKMVRFNSKTYPSPTPLEYFERHPYFASESQVERACDILSRKEEYSDIQRFTNNVGEDYLYSTKFLTYKYANALATEDDFTD